MQTFYLFSHWPIDLDNSKTKTELSITEEQLRVVRDGIDTIGSIDALYTPPRYEQIGKIFSDGLLPRMFHYEQLLFDSSISSTVKITDTILMGISGRMRMAMKLIQEKADSNNESRILVLAQPEAIALFSYERARIHSEQYASITYS